MRLNVRQRPFVENGQKGPLFNMQGDVIQVDTAGAHTYSVDEFSGPLVLRDPNGAARSDVTPTAAALIAADSGAAKGDCFTVEIRNTGTTGETITMTGGTGVTISGTATIAVDNAKEFLCVVTGPDTVALYSKGTKVF